MVRIFPTDDYKSLYEQVVALGGDSPLYGKIKAFRCAEYGVTEIDLNDGEDEAEKSAFLGVLKTYKVVKNEKGFFYTHGGVLCKIRDFLVVFANGSWVKIEYDYWDGCFMRLNSLPTREEMFENLRI